MKKLDTHYSTLSYDCDNFETIERRMFLTECSARKDAEENISNSGFMLYKTDRYVDEKDRITTKDTYIAQIVSGINQETKYLQLCGVDENNNELPIQAFDFFRNVKIKLPKIDKEYKYKYYNLYLVTENLISGETVQSYEFVATLPSSQTKISNYYNILAINEFGAEKQIASFKTLEKLEAYRLVPKEEYIRYTYNEILLIFSTDGIIEKRIPIKQISNRKETPMTRKKHK